MRLNQQLSDIVINWAGGLHHAKKSEASGFTRERLRAGDSGASARRARLLSGEAGDAQSRARPSGVSRSRRHQRVLYIDIDIHHGDGVEEAFYTTNRADRAFHKFANTSPARVTTGKRALRSSHSAAAPIKARAPRRQDVGYDVGKNYAINFPLHDGMDDDSFKSIFLPVLRSWRCTNPVRS